MERVTLNVSGKKFVTTRQTLSILPKTRLGRLTKQSREYDANSKEYFFDRDPKVMTSILGLYRTGELHVSSALCGSAIKAELDFWEIPEEMISECCWEKYSQEKEKAEILNNLDKALGSNDETGRKLTCRHKIWLTMEKPFYSTASKIWNIIYLVFVLLAIVNFILSTVKELRVRRASAIGTNVTGLASKFRYFIDTEVIAALYYIELSCIVFFTLELPIRFWACPKKLSFFKSFMNWVDILLIFIMWAAYAINTIPNTMPNLFDTHTQTHTIVTIILRSLLSLRVLRIFHIARKFDSMKVLLLTYKSSLKEILMLFTVILIAINLFGTLVYFSEILGDKNTFDNIPIALWWSVITLTTVGYGDYYPQSIPGYVVGVLCAMVGLVTLSMPIAIIATNFSAFYSCVPSRKHRLEKNAFIREHLEKFGTLAQKSDQIKKIAGNDGKWLQTKNPVLMTSAPSQKIKL